MKQFFSLTALVLGVSLTLAACGGGSGDSLSREQQYAQRCGLPAPGKEPHRLLTPTGSHCLGKARYGLRDHHRIDPTQSEKQKYREVSITVWYPAAQATASPSPRADYLQPEIARLIASGLPGAEAILLDMKTHASVGTPAASGRYPVVLFSPGVGLNSEQYSSLLEDMASHGHVVVAVDHPYVSGPVRLLDGSLAVNDAMDPAQLFTSSHVVVDDLRFTLDWLAARNADAGHLLGGRLDLRRVGAYGHSYGGSAALQLARTDARVLAGANMDGMVFGDLAGKWNFPFLLLLANGNDPSIESVWSARGPAAERHALAGMEHNSFADTKYLLGLRKGLLTPELATKLDLGTGNAEQEIARVRQLTREFLVRYLR